jgi:hypothetical protein
VECSFLADQLRRMLFQVAADEAVGTDTTVRLLWEYRKLRLAGSMRLPQLMVNFQDFKRGKHRGFVWWGTRLLLLRASRAVAEIAPSA